MRTLKILNFDCFRVVQRQGTKADKPGSVFGLRRGGEHLRPQVNLRREVRLRSDVWERLQRSRNGQTIVKRVSFNVCLNRISGATSELREKTKGKLIVYVHVVCTLFVTILHNQNFNVCIRYLK